MCSNKMKLLTSVLFGAAVCEEVCLKYWEDVNFGDGHILQHSSEQNTAACGAACFHNSDCQEGDIFVIQNLRIFS